MRVTGVVTSAVALAACCSALVGQASAASYRSLSSPFSGPAGVSGVMRLNGHAQGSDNGAVVFATRKTDRTISIRVADASSRPVRVELTQDGSGHGFVTDLGAVCGRSAAPLRLLYPGKPVQAFVVVGECGTGISFPTKGLITAGLR